MGAARDRPIQRHLSREFSRSGFGAGMPVDADRRCRRESLKIRGSSARTSTRPTESLILEARENQKDDACAPWRRSAASWSCPGAADRDTDAHVPPVRRPSCRARPLACLRAAQAHRAIRAADGRAAKGRGSVPNSEATSGRLEGVTLPAPEPLDTRSTATSRPPWSTTVTTSGLDRRQACRQSPAMRTAATA